VILLVVSSVAFSQTLNYGTFKPTKDLTISLLADRVGPPTKPPTQDVVTPVLRQKTRVTGDPFILPPNFASSAGATVQAQIAGNNLPDLYIETFIAGQPDAYQMLYENDAGWDFSDKAFLKKMFPNLTARISQYGNFEDWYTSATTYGNTHMMISSGFDPKAFQKLYASQKGTTWYRVNAGAAGAGYQILRDDILKMIYPKARSDKEQEQWYLTTFNAASPTGAGDPFSDVPINSLDSYYTYLKKVKEIIDSKNLTDATGRDKMIPAQIQAMSGPGQATSVMWSVNSSAYGYQWVDPLIYVNRDQVFYPFQQPWVKDVFKWWNKCYNEGLLDPELFVKTQTQLNEEVIRGRFAAFNYNPWANWVTPARQYAKDNNLKWGYRGILAWWPRIFKNTYYDASVQWVAAAPRVGSIITKNVKEEDLAQVCNWLDYHYSEEFDILRSWGPASFYTGTGAARRFLPAYKDLENFQAYGILNPAGKDGYYYGVTGYSAAGIDEAATMKEVTCAALCEYPYAPRYVYPVKKTAGQNYDAIMGTAVMQYEYARQVTLIPQVGWSRKDIEGPEFARIQYMWFGTHVNAVAKLIVGSTGEFEANYAAYQKVFRDNDWAKGMEEVSIAWKSIYDNYVAKYWK